MMEAHVLRYGLEAVVVGVSNGKLRLLPLMHDETHDEMVTIRLSQDLRPFLDRIRSERPDLRGRNDVLRACLNTMIVEEKKHGFAWLVALREKFI
jgi:hypothetical protein